MKFDTLIEKYRKEAFSERDKGDKFERLMQAYLRTDPKYAPLFKEVWLWKDFFGRSELGGSDTGIDLVAKTHDGEFWAIQCKCFQEQDHINKPDVDGFLATSSRHFKDENLQRTKFAQRLWISTTNRWGSNAEKAIENQDPPVVRLNLWDLRDSPVDWEKLDKGIHGETARTAKKTLRPHQVEALEKTHEHFKTHDRGKLIMACGTGKTFIALRIAEKETDGKGLVLFLVPSIALLGQSLREWFADAKETISAICICSDAEVSRKRSHEADSEFDNIVDLAYPASTNVRSVVDQFKLIQTKPNKGMTVVFSTYQSIDVVSRAQKEFAKVGFPEFDLVICDEAHRTTGVTLSGEDESGFTKVHFDENIKAKKRLYMTATPRLYGDEAKGKAAQADAVLCSMDDESLYGPEIHRIGFGEAVEHDLLTDYKVLILTLNENDVPPEIQRVVADKTKEINSDDASKLIGCINALSKQILGDDGVLQREDPNFMKRAVAFCPKITASKKITSVFNDFAAVYTHSFRGTSAETKGLQMVTVSSDHIDGTMSAPERDRKLAWLKDETADGECRILTNVRCLSEGVDVPSLDAVMFLAARNSPVDVVQSVGRVMRKAPGKRYGYIIIPILVPSDIEPHVALNDNERYKVVWTVLNALRAHDDRFNATVNKIELNKKRPDQILIGRPEVEFRNGEPMLADPAKASQENRQVSQQLQLQFEELKGAVFAKLVQKVGDRRYWEQWAKDVADIAKRQEERIKRLIADEGKHRKAFDKFLAGLRKNINPSITEQEAIDMLSQHVITKPVFEALFEDYSFVQNNAVSKSMQAMLDLLEAQAIEKDTETLQKFYESVRMRASDIDNAEAKQKIIVELYDKFFKTAFPKMVERLGIVYTPVEVVDFIINSVNDVLKQEFGRSLSDENVNILDPFTGTGTFITRLLQSGLIEPKDLERKYRHEIFANEIVLLAYYIAAVNIENAFHDALKSSPPYEGGVAAASADGVVLSGAASPPHGGVASEEVGSDTTAKQSFAANRQAEPEESEPPPSGGGQSDTPANWPPANAGGSDLPYIPFEGICLTDTFQLGENSNADDLYSAEFPQNSKRVQRQKKTPLTVIFGNPPYSVGQKSANDNAQNQSYTKLDARLAETYVSRSKATSVKSIYDPYIKAFRWASDRLQSDGVIAYITNSGWIEKGVYAGMRQRLEEEFSSIYVLNLRGGVKGKNGVAAKREGQNIFDIMTGVAITVLVKNPASKANTCRIHYFDIGEYLSRTEKFSLLRDRRSLMASQFEQQMVSADLHGDWISQRNDLFSTFPAIEPSKKFDTRTKSFFIVNSLGINSNRDAWVYNSSKKNLIQNVTRHVNFYNKQVDAYRDALRVDSKLDVNDFKDNSPELISWSSSLSENLRRLKNAQLQSEKNHTAAYRPFFKQYGYYGDKMIHRPGQFQSLFPTQRHKNRLICINGVGFRKDIFSCLTSDSISDLELLEKTQCFPLYYYEERKKDNPTLFDGDGQQEYVRRDGISDFILERARAQYGNQVTKEDIFYYVYGFLHSPEYRETFANDLKKMLPRLPLVEEAKDFWAFSRAGRKLADLHINYESVPPHPDLLINGAALPPYLRKSSAFPEDAEAKESGSAAGGKAAKSAHDQPVKQNFTPNRQAEPENYYRVEKMRFPKKGQKDTIIYNSRITVSNIPAKAYEYVVNGRSAIEWIMERYQIKIDKPSGIKNDPNDWSEEVGNPRYILDLLLSIVNVSTQTVDIVGQLPRVRF